MGQKGNKIYPKSQHIIDPKTNLKYRLCAGIIVFNTNHDILVGYKRTGSREEEGYWQCPQGGVDAEPNFESMYEAACRELYEEMGLRIPKNVIPYYKNNEDDNMVVRYESIGKNGWMEK